MKKLLLALLLLLAITPTQSQSLRKNVLYYTTNFNDWGKGFRYDHYFTTWGLYTANTIGTYRASKDAYIENHIKNVVGIIYKAPALPEQIDDPIFSFGIVHHSYGKAVYTNEFDPDTAFWPWWFELGLGGRIGRFNVGFRVEPLRWETGFDIGINF